MTASPTQQALAEIRARGHEAWERASMVELQDLSLALAAAQVAAWQCRECCGARFGERCGSKAVQIERAIKMRERGPEMPRCERWTRSASTPKRTPTFRRLGGLRGIWRQTACVWRTWRTR